MVDNSSIPPELAEHICRRSVVLRDEYQRKSWKQTDRVFAVLLVLQWLAGVAVALWISPRAWEGLDSYVNPHVWMAVFLGGVITSLPVLLALVRPGETITRLVISAAQVSHSALLIHLSGGRIETHFHVFGSLAFLSFYRDWRVLVPATIIVALDHALRGIFWPQSVFGVLTASHWRWLEHAGWVVFEDTFLFWSCIRGAREVAILALRQAELETINQRVEAEVVRQTGRLESLSQELVLTARRAGMAEIATGVLHNVGNVLNSVNVAASLTTQKVKDSEIASLIKVGEILEANQPNLSRFLTADERGKQIPGFLIELAKCLDAEQRGIIGELQSVTNGLDHLKEIVGAQQKHAKHGNLREKVTPAEIFEQAIAMNLGASHRHLVEIERDFEPIGAAAMDKHKILQILLNLLSNATKAVNASGRNDKKILAAIKSSMTVNGDQVEFIVKDNGIGILSEHLTRIFSHGFTTQKEGHGFGLHSAVNSAREMNGDLHVESRGHGCGAIFTLKIPLSGMTTAEQIELSRKQG